MTTKVSFDAKSGAKTNGFLAEPTNVDAKAPAIVLLQEYWGVNAHIQGLADRLAAEGFVVLAPDLYHGKVTTDSSEAAKMAGELDTLKAVDEIAGAVAYLKRHAGSNGNVGVVGFCLGGALAFASACHIEDLGAAVAFYGVPPAEKVDYAKVTAPILAHFGKKDQWATVAKAEAIGAQLEKHGKTMRLEVYDAGHAFMNDSRPEAYDEASAKLAWARTTAFFREHLA